LEDNNFVMIFVGFWILFLVQVLMIMFCFVTFTTLDLVLGASLGDHALLLRHDDPVAIPLLLTIFL